jgi:hypothetical protein
LNVITIQFLRQGNSETEFGLWVNSKDNKPENAFLVIGRGDAMRERFGDIMQPMPMDLSKLSPIKSNPDPNFSTTVAVRVDSESLLPITTVCLV